jgi:CRISPR-associated protein Csd2
MLERLKQDGSTILNRRYEVVFLFDVTQGNPNGDPDGDNAPRVDIETGHGLVTDVCLKRKVRNFVGLTREYAPPCDIYVKERNILAIQQKKAYVALGLNEGSDRPNENARAWMCKNFYDVRSFGAVMTTGKAPLEDDPADAAKSPVPIAMELGFTGMRPPAGPPPGPAKKGKKDTKLRQWNCGQVRGPVQFAFSRSIDPVLSLAHTITRVALTNPGDTGRASEAPEDGGEEKAATGQMGRKYTIAYGLYRCHIFLSPFLAKDTLFTHGDFALLLESLSNLFEFDHSASRGEMNVRGLFVFEHNSALGNAPSHKLFETIAVASDPTARAFSESRVTAPADGSEPLPGVHCFKIV